MPFITDVYAREVLDKPLLKLSYTESGAFDRAIVHLGINWRTRQ